MVPINCDWFMDPNRLPKQSQKERRNWETPAVIDFACLKAEVSQVVAIFNTAQVVPNLGGTRYEKTSR